MASRCWACSAWSACGTFAQGPFEYDFRKLNAKLATTEEAQQFNKIDDMFGRWPSPTIVLADTRRRGRADRQAIRAGRDGAGRRRDRADGDRLRPAARAARGAEAQAGLLAQIRKLTNDPALTVLNDKESADLAKIDRARLHELGPRICRHRAAPVHRGRRHGRQGGARLPARARLSVWNGRDLLRIASVLQIKLDDGKVIETSGFAVMFAR